MRTVQIGGCAAASALEGGAASERLVIVPGVCFCTGYTSSGFCCGDEGSWCWRGVIMALRGRLSVLLMSGVGLYF